MAEIKVSISKDMKEVIKDRAKELDVSCPEYLRTLVNLDISIQRYQELMYYSNMLYNNILFSQEKLGIVATPLQELSLVNLE